MTMQIIYLDYKPVGRDYVFDYIEQPAHSSAVSSSAVEVSIVEKNLSL